MSLIRRKGEKEKLREKSADNLISGGNQLFRALVTLAHNRQLQFARQQQRQRMKKEIGNELRQEFTEKIGAMQTQIEALTATVNTLIEESQKERQEFRKRQETRQTQAIIKEVTHTIHKN